MTREEEVEIKRRLGYLEDYIKEHFRPEPKYKGCVGQRFYYIQQISTHYGGHLPEENEERIGTLIDIELYEDSGNPLNVHYLYTFMSENGNQGKVHESRIIKKME